MEGAPVALSASSGSEPGPNLLLSSLEDARSQRLSAIYSLGLHLAILLGLVSAALLAPPEIIEKIVTIIVISPPH